MKEYDVYLPFEVKGKNAPRNPWAWLEKVLDEHFGAYAKSTAFHEGSWNGLGLSLQGKLQTYSVCGEESKSRPFFRELKERIKAMGVEEFLILEKDAPGPKGELPGERI